MDKTTLLQALAIAKAHARQGKVNVEAQKAVVAALAAIGKDPIAAERILASLEHVQTDSLSDMEKILNELDTLPMAGKTA
jgi:hypothetical protein